MAIYDVDKNLVTGVFRAKRLDQSDKTLIAGTAGRLGVIIGRRVGGKGEYEIRTNYEVRSDRAGLNVFEINNLMDGIGS